MAVVTTNRNMRDGSVVIKDNDSHTATIVCDEGNLSWTNKKDPKVQMCRGTITGIRPGNQVPCELSTTIKWGSLISFTNNSSDSVMPYELIMNAESAFTSWDVGDYCLKWEFSVASPTGSAALTSEKITFNKVYLSDLKCSEGEESNTMDFSGASLETKPTITRY